MDMFTTYKNQEYHTSYTIEKDIPLREPEDINFPFDKMEVGDSFFMPLVEWVLMGYSNSNFGFWGIAKKKAPKNHSYKIRSAVQYGHNGCRVWRVR